MITPTIHMNGDTAQTLEEQWKAVYIAAHALLEAVLAARPNGRNYYPQGEEAILVAQNEHRQREKAVVALSGDAYQMLKAIKEQGK